MDLPSGLPIFLVSDGNPTLPLGSSHEPWALILLGKAWEYLHLNMSRQFVMHPG